MLGGLPPSPEDQMSTPQTLRCPRCGRRPLQEFRRVFHQVQPGWEEGIELPPLDVIRHKPCAAVAIVPPEEAKDLGKIGA